MRERLTIQKAIGFPESLAEKVEAEAKRLNASFSEIVRECVEKELPRLKERERKRILTRKSYHQPAQEAETTYPENPAEN